jgi:Zn-dependent peptidase ImmA (M78 family)
MGKVADFLQSMALPAEDIAARSRLPVERVHDLLAGAPPNLSELRALSGGLGVPMRALALGRRASDRDDELGVLFRTAVRDTDQFERTVEDVASFVDAALEIMPPRARMPDWLEDFATREETYQEAHRLASLFRETFLLERGDEPLTDLADILVNQLSCIVSQLRFSRYEGASLLTSGYAFIFVSPRFAGRMLFTLAHELGHLVAHREPEPAAVFERVSQIIQANRASRRERFVDAFASILLLPDRGVGMGLRKIRELFHVTSPSIGDVEILWLSRFFGVSFAVAARRCEDLELLPPGGAVALTSRLKKDFGSPERRAEELGLPPRAEVRIPRISSNLMSAIVRKIDSGEISIGWAAERFGLSIDELYKAHGELIDEHSS